MGGTGYQPVLVGNLPTRLGRVPCRDEEMRSEKLDVALLPAGSPYVFTLGSTGDSPVPSGDPPDGTEHGIEGNNALFSHSSYTTTPPGESPGGAGGSPAPPSVNRYGSPAERAGCPCHPTPVKYSG